MTKATTKSERRPAKMRDVAMRAGVSVITVSRALSQPEKLAAATRARVLQAVQELGFVPNTVAQSLSSNRTKMFAAIVPNIGNPIYARTIYAMGEVLLRHDLQIMLGNSGFLPAEEERILLPFLARRPEGIMLHNRQHTAVVRNMLRNSGIPVVETGDLDGSPMDMLVSYSNADAARAMTNHLLDRGYRQIGFVSTPVRTNNRHFLRRQGFFSALSARELAVNPRHILEVEFGLRSGAKALDTLLTRDPRIDAVFFASDVLAVGASLECLRRGWAVPDRIAIAGFDDQEIASEAIPRLTTIRVPREEIGHYAAEMLVGRLGGQKIEKRIVDVGFKLIVREST